MELPGKIALLGSGSWATALAKIVLSTQDSLAWHFRKKEQIDAFKEHGHNPGYLTSARFDTNRIHFTTDIAKLFREADTIILCTPSPFIKSHLNRVRSSLFRNKMFISAIKGIVPDENMLISDYLMKEYDVPQSNIAVVSGPTHAEEIAFGRLSYLTIGCHEIGHAEQLKSVFTNDYLISSISRDVDGIEYASVLKNIYSIAAGICSGLNMGDNFQAVLISNAIAEMNNFVNTVHLIEREITDSVYLGDLLVTSYSQFSRNRTFGNMIGKGFSVKEAQREMEMIAEGYFGAKCIREVNKRYKANIPIADTIYDILYTKKDPSTAIKELTKTFR